MIKIYGRLEQHLNETNPERRDMLFTIGTLKNKLNLSNEHIQEVISTKSNWNDYTRKKAAEFLKVPTSTPIFFSPLKEPQSVKIWKFNKGYVRSCYDNEVSLDIDSKEQFDLGVRFFKLVGFYGNCRTWKGARGGHISLFFESPVTNEFRKQCRFVFGGDPHSINISVEGKPHHRTGNLVYLIAENLLEK